MNYLGTIFGLIGLAFMIISVVSSDKSKILKSLKLKSIFYALQYLCMSKMSGCTSMVLGIFRADLINRKEKNPKLKKPVLAFLITIYAVNSVLTYRSPLDFLTIFGNTLYLTTLWCFKDIGIKIGTIFVLLTFLTYNMLIGAYPSVAGDIISLVITFLYLFRYYYKDIKKFVFKKNKKDKVIEKNLI